MIDYLEKGKTVTDPYYATLLECSNDKLKEKRPRLARKKVVLHQDNVPAHTSAVTMAKVHDWASCYFPTHTRFGPV